jgi:hypothetical protein
VSVARALGLTVGIAVGLAACGGADGGSVAVGDEGGAASGAQEFEIAVAWIDPQDDRHLIFLVDGCSDGGTARVDERPNRVTVALAATPVDVPCVTEEVEVRLEAPVGDRAVIDASDGEHLELVEAAFLHPQPAPPRPAADCTADSVHEAVEHEIDGGLHASVRSCNGTWLVVETSANACPATGEAPAAGCITNRHVAYFRNVDDHWSVFAFDDCEVVAREDSTFPEELCSSSNQTG